MLVSKMWTQRTLFTVAGICRYRSRLIALVATVCLSNVAVAQSSSIVR
jgi:hypothetical protein